MRRNLRANADLRSSQALSILIRSVTLDSMKCMKLFFMCTDHATQLFRFIQQMIYDFFLKPSETITEPRDDEIRRLELWRNFIQSTFVVTKTMLALTLHGSNI